MKKRRETILSFVDKKTMKQGCNHNFFVLDWNTKQASFENAIPDGGLMCGRFSLYSKQSDTCCNDIHLVYIGNEYEKLEENSLQKYTAIDPF